MEDGRLTVGNLSEQTQLPVYALVEVVDERVLAANTRAPSIWPPSPDIPNLVLAAGFNLRTQADERAEANDEREKSYDASVDDERAVGATRRGCFRDDSNAS